jgi:hypothetical protein
MEQDNQKPKTLGLAVYIPLILTIGFAFLLYLASHVDVQYVAGLFSNPFYEPPGELRNWDFPAAFLTIAFWFLMLASLITTVAMVIMRTALVKLRKENKPVSKKANIIVAMLIVLVVFIVWFIYKSGIH